VIPPAVGTFVEEELFYGDSYIHCSQLVRCWSRYLFAFYTTVCVIPYTLCTTHPFYYHFVRLPTTFRYCYLPPFHVPPTCSHHRCVSVASVGVHHTFCLDTITVTRSPTALPLPLPFRCCDTCVRPCVTIYRSGTCNYDRHFRGYVTTVQLPEFHLHIYCHAFYHDRVRDGLPNTIFTTPATWVISTGDYGGRTFTVRLPLPVRCLALRLFLFHFPPPFLRRSTVTTAASSGCSFRLFLFYRFTLTFTAPLPLPPPNLPLILFLFPSTRYMFFTVIFYHHRLPFYRVDYTFLALRHSHISPLLPLPYHLTIPFH